MRQRPRYIFIVIDPTSVLVGACCLDARKTPPLALSLLWLVQRRRERRKLLRHRQLAFVFCSVGGAPFCSMSLTHKLFESFNNIQRLCTVVDGGLAQRCLEFSAYRPDTASLSLSLCDDNIPMVIRCCCRFAGSDGRGPWLCSVGLGWRSIVLPTFKM